MPRFNLNKLRKSSLVRGDVPVRNPRQSLKRAAGQAVFELLEIRQMLSTSTFGYTGSIQTFTAPSTGTYQISVAGAQGGGAGGGDGAVLNGDVTLTQFTTLEVVVGGQGDANQYSDGGGGGSFVYVDSTSPELLFAAGGGGGNAASYSNSSAQLGQSGEAAGGSTAASGGSGGLGGQEPAALAGGDSGGGGGGGWLGNGGSGAASGEGFAGGEGGDGPPNFTGGTGNYLASNPSVNSNGGFGGGGAGGLNTGGGGGGYSGGDGGGEVSNGYGATSAGGGGGSYFGSAVANTASAVTQTGNGTVTITGGVAYEPPSYTVPYETTQAVQLTANSPVVITYALLSQPSDGYLSDINSQAGTLDYTPNALFSGTDSFTYEPIGIYGPLGTLTVTLNVQAPTLVANPLTFDATYERTQTLVLTANNADRPVTYGIVTSPANGTLSNFNSATGTVRYTPQTGFEGTDTFQYKAMSAGQTVTNTVTVDVAPSTTAPFMSTLSDNTPLSDISLPGTNQSESGPDLENSLLGNNASSVVSTGAEAENDEALHITSSLTSAAISTLAAAGVNNTALTAAGVTADLAATAADSRQGVDGSNAGVGLGLSLASDGLTEVSDVYGVQQLISNAITTADDSSTTPATATEEADAAIDAQDHTAAATANTAAVTPDATAGTENSASATDNAAADALNTTAGTDDTAAAVVDGTADGLDIAAEAQGGVDPGSDIAAAASDGAAAAEDATATATDGAADASNVAADTTDADASVANSASTPENTAAETTSQNAGAEDSATSTLAASLIADLDKLVSDHRTSAANDGLSATSMALSAAGDAYTSEQFITYVAGLSNPDTTGGNSYNAALQKALYNDALAESTTHTASATAETAAATADTVASVLDAAAASADGAAATAVQEQVTANAAALQANEEAITAIEAAIAANEAATGDDATAESGNAAAIVDNTTAATLDAAAGVSDAADAAANTAAAAADIAAIALDATAAATAAVPFVDIATAAAAAAGEAVAVSLDAVSDGTDTAAEVTDTAAIPGDSAAAPLDATAATEDTTASAAAAKAAEADEAAVTALENAATADAEATAASDAAQAACEAADTANSAADTADKAANVANAAASTAGAAASSADVTFTTEATTVQTIETGAQTQTLTVADQLNAGIRALDVQTQDVNDTINVNSGEYFSGDTLQDTLNDVTSFLQANPTETVVITLGNENASVGSSKSFNTDLANLLTSQDSAVPGSTYDSFVYSSSNASQVPELGEVRGKIVFVPNADQSWTPANDPTTNLPIGWQPTTQIVQDSHTDTDPNARWNDAETGGGNTNSGLIATDVGNNTTLYTNNLNMDNSFTASVTDTTTNGIPSADLTESGLSPVESGDDVDAIGDTFFAATQVSRTTGIVGIDDPDQTLITEIADETPLPIMVTSDLDQTGVQGTLRDAINQANASPGFNTIEFAPQLTGPTGNDIFLQSNLPAITNHLVVAGPVDIVLNGFTGFSPSSSPGVSGQGSSYTTTETEQLATDSGVNTPTTSTYTAPQYVDTSGVTVTNVAPPIVDPINITYGTALSNSQLSGSQYTDTNGVFADIPGTLAFVSANGTLLHAGDGQLEQVTFTPTNTNFNPSTAYVTVNVAKAVPTIPSLPSISLTYGTELANSQLSGLSKPSGISGTYVYTTNAGSLLHASSNAQTEAVTFVPSDARDYESVSSTVSVNVAQATPTLTAVNAVNISYGTALANIQLSGTATATVNDSSVNVPGTFTFTTAVGSILSTGSHSENVTFTPADTTDYKAVSSTVTVNVSHTQQATTIASVNPVNITYGTALDNSQLSGTATYVLNGVTLTLPGTFSYTTASGTLLHAGQGYTENVTFTPTDTTDYTTATSTVTVNVAKAVATIQDPVNITYGTPLDNSQLQGTATFLVNGNTVVVPGTFAYVNVGAILPAGSNQSQPIVFTPTDSTDYAPADSTVIVNVAQATPSLSYSTQANSSAPVVSTPGVAPVNIQYTQALTNDVAESSSNPTPNQLNATATYTVDGTVVDVPGLLSYTSAAGTVLNAGNGQTQSVTFTPTDTTDYATVQTTVTVNVSQLVPTVTLTDGSQVAGATSTSYASYSTPYTGSPQPATGTVLDANGNSIGTPVISYYLATDTTLSNPLPGAPNSPGNYLIAGTFAAPNSNYLNSGDTISFSITLPPTTTMVADAGGTYNGSPFPATSTVTGAGLDTTASSYSYVGTGSTVYAASSTAPINAGTYTVTAFYAGDASHAPSNSSAVAFTILQAPSITSVSDASGTYTGNPFTATSTVTGAGGLNTTASSYLYTGTGSTNYNSSTAPTNPGTYAVTASYSGDANHLASSSDAADFTIGLASSTVTVVAGGVYTGSPLPATISVTGPGGLNTSASNVTYVGTGSTGYSASSMAPTSAGTYTVTANYDGDADHNGSTSGPVPFIISKAAAVTKVVDAGGEFTGQPFTASATVTGVSGSPTASLEGVTPTLTYYAGSTATGTPLAGAPTGAGTYTVLASFGGSADYTAASASATYSITQATPTVSVTASGGTYNGQPFAASATVTGVSGVPASSLEGVTPTLTYYAGSTATGTPLAGAPSVIGTYTVVAWFPGSADYTAAAPASITFSIDETPSLVVNTTQDVVNPTDGLTSLREAVTYADTLSSPATITFDPAVFSKPQTITLTQGDLELSNTAAAITIDASSVGGITISGNDASNIFQIDAGTTVTLKELTITGGSAPQGGGIDNSGTLTVTDSTLSGDSAVGSNGGGGFYGGNGGNAQGGGIYSSGTLMVVDSTLTSDSAVGGFGGGGLFGGNGGNGQGGGIYASGTLTITDSTLSDDSAIGQAGAYSPGEGGNGGNGQGGGIYGSGKMTLTGSTISGDTASGGDGGGYSQGGIGNGSGGTSQGGGIDDDGDLTISQSAIINNMAVNGAGLGQENTAQAFITNTTFAQNTASNAGGAIDVYNDFGSGMAYQLDLIDDTLAYNTADVEGGGLGVGTTRPKALTVSNTIVADNTAPTNADVDDPGNVLAGNTSNDLIGGTPLLGTPGNYGGSTETIPLLPGSPAIGAGAPIANITIDQTGYIRSTTAPSIGAYESEGFTISATGGGGQSAVPLTPFATALGVQVASDNPLLTDLAGGMVTFTAPATGAGATFSSNPITLAANGTGSTIATANSTPGSYSVTATASGITNAAVFGLTNAKLNAGITLGSLSPTYTGNPQFATVTTTPVGLGCTIAYTQNGNPVASPVNAGTYAFTVTINDPTYQGTASGSLVIGQAQPTLALSAPGGTFNASPIGATATVTGVSGTSTASLEGVAPELTYYAGSTATGMPLAGAPTNAGTYTVVASFAGSTDYAAASASATYSIAQAEPMVAITADGGTYTGSLIGATATVTGVSRSSTASLEGVAPELTYYTGSTATGTPLADAPTNAGTYTVVASFAGSDDYTAASASATYSIAEAPSTVTVTDTGGTYSGSSFAATGKVSGAGGLSATPSISYVGTGSTIYAASSTAPTNAGTYSVTASYAGDANHTGSSATTTFSIAQAKPSITVTENGGVYTGLAYTATGTATGVNGVSLGAPSFEYFLQSDTQFANPLASAPSTVGSYVVIGFTPANSNYIQQGEAVYYRITPAKPTLALTANGGTYNGQAFAASATVTGVSGTPAGSLESVAPTLLYYTGPTASGTGSSSAPVNAGTYTVVASFAGSGDYSSASLSKTFSIAQAASVVAVSNPPVLTVGDGSFESTSVNGSYVYDPTTTYWKFTGNAGIEANGSAWDAASAPNGTQAAFLQSLSATAGGSISQTLSVSTAGTYEFTFYAAQRAGKGTEPITISVDGTVLATITPSSTSFLSYATPALKLSAGSHVLEFSTASTSSSDSDSFIDEVAALPVDVYNASPFAATATVSGAGGLSTAPTNFSYAGINGTTYGPTATAPTNAGTYTVTANYTGDANHTASSSSPVAFAIIAAPTSIAISSSAASGVDYGHSVTLSATVSAVAPGGGTPVGSVQFFSNGTSLGTAALVNGVASISTSSLAPGNDAITATYVPSSANFSGISGGGSFSQPVNVGIVLLDTKSAGALSVSGAATVNAGTGSIVVDSSNSQAIQVTGSSVVESGQTDVVGGAYVQPYSGTATNLHTGQASVGDPYASVAAPTTSGLTVQSKSTLFIAGISVVTLQPGVYIGGININGAAKVTLAPGVYYLEGGGLNVGGSTTLTGTGVLIYNAAVTSSDQININGAASVKLSPMTTGTWAGMTLFQSRTATAAMVVSGIGSVDVTGAVYAASAAVDIVGAGVVDTFGTSLIVDDLCVSGIGELLV